LTYIEFIRFKRQSAFDPCLNTIGYVNIASIEILGEIINLHQRFIKNQLFLHRQCCTLMLLALNVQFSSNGYLRQETQFAKWNSWLTDDDRREIGDNQSAWCNTTPRGRSLLLVADLWFTSTLRELVRGVCSQRYHPIMRVHHTPPWYAWLSHLSKLNFLSFITI